MSDATLVAPSWIQPLGWALVQFFWQGTLIVMLFAAVRGLCGRWLTPQSRYLLACVALAVMVAAPVITFVAGTGLAAGTRASAWPLATAGEWHLAMPWLVAAWACGVMVFSIRLLGAWRVATRLRSAGVQAAPDDWHQILECLARRLSVPRPVRLLVSPLVEVPSIVGWLKPVVLMPVGALAGLPAEHVAALLAHELAHVRRHDYLVNMLQRAVETLLFYHPAVWWLSGQIRAEREMCCDDLAVAAHGDALTYARALTELEVSRRAQADAALAASGTSLVARIRRLLGQGQSIAHLLPGPGAVLTMSALWIVGLGALAAREGSTASSVSAPSAGGAEAVLQSSDRTHALLSAVLFGPIGPSHAAQSQQPSTPTATPGGAPGDVSDRMPLGTRQTPQTGTGVIRGRILRADTGQPLRKVRVSLRAQGVGDLPVATTDDEGRYELEGLPPARFTLTASKGGFVTLEYGQRRPNETGRPIDLEDDQTLDRVDLALQPGGAINGVVLDAYGEPLAGVIVQALRQQFFDGRRVPDAGPPVTADVTNDLGQFRLFGLPAGSYFLGATDSGAQGPGIVLMMTPTGRAVTFYPGTHQALEAVPIPVEAGQDVDGLSFAVTPPRSASIEGVVRTADGRVPSGAALSLGQPSMDGWSFRNGSIRPDGSFAFPNLSPGEYTITARLNSPGRQIATAQVLLDEDAVSIALTMRTGDALRGRMTFETNTPRAALEPSSVRLRLEGVDATPSFPFADQVSLRDNWTFEAEGLAGRYRLRATLPNGWGIKAIRRGEKDVTDQPLEFSGDDVEGVEVQLTNRLTTIAGSVSDTRGQKVTDATVVMFADDAKTWRPGSRFVRIARPDQDGRYRIEGLPPARYLAVAVDFLEKGSEWSPDTLDRLRKLGTDVRLSEGESRTLDLKVSPTP
jgi:beta-lactamase regulating signal transducer with metallopeptidase domain